jgi:hypothetical protein
MGKKKYIETPEKMLELFYEYAQWCEDNPIPKTVKGNKGFIISDEKLRRCLTMEGFENYCFDQGIISDMSHYFANYEDRYSDYLAVCSLIRRKIRQDQIEGGMAGIYNASITQRLNGLTENVKQTVVQEQPLFPDVSKDK